MVRLSFPTAPIPRHDCLLVCDEVAASPSECFPLAYLNFPCFLIFAKRSVMDDEQLEAARNKDQMAIFRDEVLSSIDLKNDSIDLGTTIERAALEDKEYTTDNPVAQSRTASTTDSGLEVDFEAPFVSSTK
ncbi:unnamed protein product [Cylicocyclus nassatus]|uniref:Uncharacterized protein n=1 Tax=Cylicocyclus nassatus TaxID=53992 RepID=A0AA36M6P8_CYLNA|nr:unnamed protein product [Cylicocyclus nassatus]